MNKPTRRTFLELIPTAAALGYVSSASAANEFEPGVFSVWYQQPATKWEEALPIGNGRLGAMIFGNVENERLQLNEITVWSGKLEQNPDRLEAYKSLEPIRELIRQEKYEEAAKAMTANRTCLSGGWAAVGTYGSYQTLGDLNIDFAPASGAITNYRRWLNIGDATAGVSYQVGDDVWTRELFSSATDQVVVMKIACSKSGAVNLKLRLSRVQFAETKATASDTLTMIGTSLGQPGDLRYEAQVRVLTTGGSVAPVEGGLEVKNADVALVLMAAGTDYIPEYNKSYKGTDPHEAVTRTLASASSREFGALRSGHVKDYQRYFQRVSISLGDGTGVALPTDQRLKKFSAGADDLPLVALFYQFGRYLLISSSRPENAVPSNSQGLWGDGLKLPWGCDYKSNINFQMNYWPVETANLSECHTPMLRMIQGMVEPGRKTAQAYFNGPGWVMAYTTNVWGWTAPGGAGPWGPFFCGGAWVCQHLWEHYAFTRDREYLKKIYPVMKGASEACLHMLVSDGEGHLVTCPATSPENTFQTDDGKKGWACSGTAIERQIIWELFHNTIWASSILDENNGFAGELKTAMERIRPPQIGRAGQLMEWDKDWDLNSPEIHHRHISHLFALHPGRQISPLTTPELADAARRSLELRGDEGTGWSKAWKINCWARLHDGDRAFRLIREQLTAVDTTQTNYQRGGGTYLNLFDAHPPFQIDGNFGAVSGITEMLVQSHMPYQAPDHPQEDRYYLHLFPALPATWLHGEIKGIRARGGLELDLSWKNGKPDSVALRPMASSQWRLRAPKGHPIASVASGGSTAQTTAQADGSMSVELKKSQQYQVTFS